MSPRFLFRLTTKHAEPTEMNLLAYIRSLMGVDEIPGERANRRCHNNPYQGAHDNRPREQRGGAKAVKLLRVRRKFLRPIGEPELVSKFSH